MPSHPESNPHFGIPQNQERHFQSPSPGVATPLHQNQHNQPPGAPLPRTSKPKRQDRRNQPLGSWAMLPERQGQHIQSLDPQVPRVHQHPRKHSPQEMQPKHRHQDHHSPPHALLPPPPHTTLKTRCFAGFWACFWTVIVLIGLVILVVYLITRPHKPQFDVSNVTLNAAYLAPDVLLHADLTMQVKFTNPNRNAKMDFGYMVIDLYYGSILIASQNVEPFSLPKAVYSLQVVKMVTSTQIQLPVPDMERLQKQLSYNAVEFEIKGAIRSRVKRGRILRYSYRQHVDCTFTVNGPPSGVLTAKYCKIKG
ncbi:hypothetical protein Ddye_031402 [Dipteronia dyeriana]|uniref:Late embryogenesis abundant protein LEA-2 subgroup domain-containing protein n=1 Tax=Dipteronia dyeriana TaxID=168575 RepID=A0AAD9TJF5_9ROSI|nr:hypothetical protein Ddye_031402 [Dipteronia dyeriana]